MTVTEPALIAPRIAPRKGRWINEWHPDDPAFWESTGKKVARRNLAFSIFAEHLGFTLWTVWSIVTVKLGAYTFSTDQLFWIVALPNLVGSTLRIPYTFAPAKFGGRGSGCGDRPRGCAADRPEHIVFGETADGQRVNHPARRATPHCQIT